MSSALNVTVVSSAYIAAVPELKQFGKSFMKIKNNSGPSTEPCRTPHFIGRLCDM